MSNKSILAFLRIPAQIATFCGRCVCRSSKKYYDSNYDNFVYSYYYLERNLYSLLKQIFGRRPWNDQIVHENENHGTVDFFLPTQDGYSYPCVLRNVIISLKEIIGLLHFHQFCLKLLERLTKPDSYRSINKKNYARQIIYSYPLKKRQSHFIITYWKLSLFLLMINDISLNLRGNFFTIFADGTSSILASPIVKKLSKKSTTSIKQMKQWCLLNGLVLNKKKRQI